MSELRRRRLARPLLKWAERTCLVALTAVFGFAPYTKARHFLVEADWGSTAPLLRNPLVSALRIGLDATVIGLLLLGYRRAGYVGAMLIAVGGNLLLAYLRYRYGNEATCGCFGRLELSGRTTLLRAALFAVASLGLFSHLYRAPQS